MTTLSRNSLNNREGASLPPTIHVIDEDPEVICALKALLEANGIRVETHTSADQFFKTLPSLNPDSICCILIELRAPDQQGVAVIERLRASGMAQRVIVMTATADVPTAVQAMKAGAFDVIEKPCDGQTLLRMIRTVPGFASAPDAGPQAALRPPPLAVAAAQRMLALSKREREVLALVIEGKPRKAIASELGLSPRTIEVHRARMVARLGVGSFVEVVRLAILASLARDGGDVPPQPQLAAD